MTPAPPPIPMLSLLLSLAASGAPTLPAVPPPHPVGTASAQDPETPGEVERLAEWPKLTDEARIEKDVKRLRAANTDTMGIEARDALIADGAMTAPLLLRAFSRETNAEARERIVEVLEAVVGPPHTRLLAEWFDERSVPVRLWSRKKAARYGDAGLRKAAQDVWKKVEKQGEKADPEEVEITALLLTSTGDLSQLERVIAYSQEHWVKEVALLREIFGSLRGGETGAVLGKALEGAPRQRASTVLRLLAAAGTPEELKYVRPFLDQNDNTLRVDAINACRAIVDGEPPLDRLAVFEAIEMAKKWKERL